MLSRHKPTRDFPGGDFDVVTGPPAPMRRPIPNAAAAPVPALPAPPATPPAAGRADKPAT